MTSRMSSLVLLLTLSCVLLLIKMAHGQRQVFALIPLDGSGTFARPQKANIANVANPPAVSQDQAIVGNSEIQSQPTPLPNSVALSVTNGTDESTSTSTTADSTSTSTTTTSSASVQTQQPNNNSAPVEAPTSAPVVGAAPAESAPPVQAPSLPAVVGAPVDSAGAAPASRPIGAQGPRGVYVKTSAAPKPCAHHYDCYGLREPDDWCQLSEVERFLDKGCFCDITRGLCTIQRLSELGAQYSDCGEKTSSACSNQNQNNNLINNEVNKARQHLN